jgi:Domain of unknown function DUF302
MNTPYGFGTPLQVAYEEAIPRVKEALKAEGFGVLTEIDVRQTLREKLGAEMEPYIILGACNLQLAHRALEQEPALAYCCPAMWSYEPKDRGAGSTSLIHWRCWAWWVTATPSHRRGSETAVATCCCLARCQKTSDLHHRCSTLLKGWLCSFLPLVKCL